MVPTYFTKRFGYVAHCKPAVCTYTYFSGVELLVPVNGSGSHANFLNMLIEHANHANFLNSVISERFVITIIKCDYYFDRSIYYLEKIYVIRKMNHVG